MLELFVAGSVLNLGPVRSSGVGSFADGGGSHVESFELGGGAAPERSMRSAGPALDV